VLPGGRDILKKQKKEVISEKNIIFACPVKHYPAGFVPTLDAESISRGHNSLCSYRK